MDITHSEQQDGVWENGERPVVDDGLIDRLMDQVDAEGLELLGPDGVLSEVTSRVLNRAPQGEMTDHLGYGKGDPAGWGTGDSRNCSCPKTVLTDAGGIDIGTCQ